MCSLKEEMQKKTLFLKFSFALKPGTLNQMRELFHLATVNL